MTGGSAGTVITGALIMGALVYKIIDLVKYLVVIIRFRWDQSADRDSALNSALNGLVTLILGCAAGIGVVFLMANTTWSDQIQLGNQTLKALPATSLIVLGLVITSLAAMLFDIKKAVDGTDSASTPKLLPKADEARRERVRAKREPADATLATRIGNLEQIMKKEVEDVERALAHFHGDGETTPTTRSGQP